MKILSNPLVRTTDQAYELLKNMKFHEKEILRCLYLNSRYRLIRNEIISIGAVDFTIVHPQEIFRPAIECGAKALILGHNHPSGEITPSREDLETTKDIVKIAEMLQIPILDHLIIGENGYFSLFRAGIIT